MRTWSAPGPGRCLFRTSAEIRRASISTSRFHTVVSLHLIMQVKSHCRCDFPGLVLEGNAEAGCGQLCGWWARPAPRGHHGLQAERPLLFTLQLPIPALTCGHTSKSSWRPVCLCGHWAGGPQGFALLLQEPEQSFICAPYLPEREVFLNRCLRVIP